MITLLNKIISWIPDHSLKRLVGKGYRWLEFYLVVYWKETVNSKPEMEFIQLLHRYKSEWDPENKKVVLVQIVKDFELCVKLAALSKTIAEQNSSNIGFVSVATQLEEPLFRNQFIWDHFYSESSYKKLDRMFLSFGGKLLMRNVHYNGRGTEVERLYKNMRRQISDKSSVVNLSIEGIVVGDLIYDTYLRFKNTATIVLDDPFLDKVLRVSVNIYLNILDLLDKFEFTALLTTYATYIHHGIAVRVFLSKKIPVYTIGSHNSIVHKVCNEYPGHHNNHFNYHLLFQKLNKKQERLGISRTIFEKRFDGVLDSGITYMRESSFQKHHDEALDEIQWSSTIVILAHCFFDSPHNYRSLLFPDLYEWMTFSLDVLTSRKDCTILVKPHPNGQPGNDLIFEQLRAKYSQKNVIFIDKRTSNLQILESKPKAVVTAYGTAAAEFAYQSIPVICVYDNPFTAYNFTFLAKTIDEYRKILLEIDKMSLKIEKEEILEYYYMQSVFFNQGIGFDMMNCLKYKGQTYSDEFLTDYLPELTDAFFNRIESTLKIGLEICEWEEMVIQKKETTRNFDFVI
jgi:hypothetical protein